MQLLKLGIITKEKYRSLKDKKKRRLFLNEFDRTDANMVVAFFRANKMLVVTDIIRGNDEYPAGWMLVTLYNKEKHETKWALTDINKAISIFERGEVEISPKGSLNIGQIGMQRKGGDGGRKSANQLQFKINPSILFDS